MNNLNGYSRLLILMILVFAICYSLYYVPSNVGSYPIKRIDLLSELRVKENITVTGQDTVFVEDADSIEVSQPVNEVAETVYTQKELQIRDSLYREFRTIIKNTDIHAVIEDNSVGRTALSNFFSAIEKKDKMKRPVRIGFFGDSFIEGDMVVGHFREHMQSEYGGKGVGFIPIVSIVGDFRKTISQRQSGWKLSSVMKTPGRDYNQTGQYFYSDSEETNLSVTSTEFYKNTYPYGSVKLYYDRSKNSEVCIISSHGDTIKDNLNATYNLTHKEWKGEFRDFEMSLSNSDSLRLVGLALESDTGIIVDNHSLRGNMGIFFSNLDSIKCEEFSNQREYDLIILQYGINVMQDTVVNYGWYANNMVKVINRFKTHYPHADILVLGVPDRAYNDNGVYKTMPAVSAITKAQRYMARKCDVSFLSIYELMGGDNSMVQYVENGWASKDYTHMSFRGGRDIARKLFNVIIKEKEFYDKARSVQYEQID